MKSDCCGKMTFKPNVSSTPLKRRRSLSLVDVSTVEKDFTNLKSVSDDTLGSRASIFRDSGYNQTGSESSLGSVRDQKRISDLEEELKYKLILIKELEDSNYSLRIKFAEAENKITELRLRCESHCGCCKTNPDLNASPVQTSRRSDDLPKRRQTINFYPSEDENFLKVKRWQNQIGDGTKSSVKSYSSDYIKPKSNLASPSFVSTSESRVSTPSLPQSTITYSPKTNRRYKNDSLFEKRTISSDSEESNSKEDLRLQERLSGKDLPVFGEPLNYNCRNRKLEMEERIKSGLRRIVLDKKDTSEPYSCWKNSLQSYSSDSLQSSKNPLLQKLKEINHDIKECKYQNKFIMQRNLPKFVNTT